MAGVDLPGDLFEDGGFLWVAPDRRRRGAAGVANCARPAAGAERRRGGVTEPGEHPLPGLFRVTGRPDALRAASAAGADAPVHGPQPRCCWRRSCWPRCGEPAGGARRGRRRRLGEWELAEGTADGAALPRRRAPGDAPARERRGRRRLVLQPLQRRPTGSTATRSLRRPRRHRDGLRAGRDGGRERLPGRPSAPSTRAAVDGDDLVLTGDGVRLRFTPVAPVPDSPLEGTRWVLETLVEGETAVLDARRAAVLLLDPDRTARRRPPAAGRSPAPGWSRTARWSSTTCSPTAPSARPTSSARTRT